MNPSILKILLILATGVFLGFIAANQLQAVASNQSDKVDFSEKRFLVSVHEIQQKFVFGEEFSGSYTNTFELSDGSVRTIELTPMLHDGRQVVEFKDTGGRTYMGFNGTTTNGKLMVQLRDIEAMYAELKKQGFDIEAESGG